MSTSTTAQSDAQRAVATGRAPVAIEARNIEKTFRIPTHRVDSLKERAVHPFARAGYRELHVLRGVSFDIQRGEFFGVVGRNGSGKSTLLKILAGIYSADAGTIRMAGRVAPFIELGVGFNTDLSARENVVLNGVMMGLTRQEAQRRLDAVLDFAELRDFADLKLKNYSSGMMVRLAFSVMIQADADIMLIDEVLAVGDAAFQQKCSDYFHDIRGRGRTIVLVTHDMGTVERYCHRAMLIHDGDLVQLGDPNEVARGYLRLNFEASGAEPGARKERAVPDQHTRLIDAWLESPGGGRVENAEIGEPIRFHAVLEATEEMESPAFSFHFIDADGSEVFGFNEPLAVEVGEPERLRKGERAHISATIENRLMPGRYFVRSMVSRHRERGDLAIQAFDVFDFVVFGPRTGPGVVSMPVEVEAVPVRGEIPGGG